MFSSFSAPPEYIKFYREPGAEPVDGVDFTSGAVTFNISNSGIEDAYNATCLAKSARPMADVSWWIGDYQIPYNDSIMHRTTERTNDEAFDIYDTLLLNPRAGFDGKVLRCQYDHEAYKDEDLIADPSLNRATVNITVFC